METSVLATYSFESKFRGCLIGSLVGDCIGVPYEFSRTITDPSAAKSLENDFNKILSGESTEIFQYSDDTAMTLSVTKSLIENKKICPIDLAKRFTTEYFKNPNRCYGAHVQVVFKALRDSNFKDVFRPAQTQFDGSGSFGNGAAMRIAPIALFACDKDEDFIKNAVEQCSFVTHTHPDGYNGAMLQCLAIQMALKLDSAKELDPVKFISELKDKMKKVEKKGKTPFCDLLKKMKNIYQKKQEYNMSPKEVVQIFGNDEIALKSVPTAIYVFLRSLKPLPVYETQNPFIRAIYFAISLGGDTDTIGTMACGISGAYYGESIIPSSFKRRCESIDEVEKSADELLKISQP